EREYVTPIENDEGRTGNAGMHLLSEGKRDAPVFSAVQDEGGHVYPPKLPAAVVSTRCFELAGECITGPGIFLQDRFQDEFSHLQDQGKRFRTAPGRCQHQAYYV